MRVPLDWLKEYVKIKTSAEELVERLTIAGLEVASVEDKAYGKVFEIEITTNRPDWLSLIGIAREVSALQAKKSLEAPSVNLAHQEGFNKLFKISVLNKEKCPRYTARIIEGVKVGPAPSWLKRRIESLGLRSVSNIVDITNFVLFEYGQPLHAFDLDKLKGSQLSIRLAKNNEKITTIDGIERTLPKNTLVIADSQRPVAIAGIMGGEYSQVDRETKNILLESAYFDGPSVRRTSRKIGLASDSSYRFERGVDWQAVKDASDRAASLICQYAGGKIRSEFFDSSPKKKPLRKITLKIESLTRILGIKVDTAKVKSILGNLGLSLKRSTKNALVFEIPSFRQDLKIEEDLIEEIVRIWGYDKIPVYLPIIKPTLEIVPSDLHKLKYIARETFTSIGFNEIITHSLISRDILKNLRVKTEELIAVQNPLSSEVEILRPTLLPSVLQILSYNLNRRMETVKIFELAHVYSRRAGKMEEKLNLGFGLSGSKYIYDWQDKPKDLNFFDMKGAVEVLFRKLGISDFDFSQVGLLNLFNQGQSAAITCHKKVVGYVGEICEELLDGFDVRLPLFAGELYLEELLGLVNLTKKFKPFPSYPFVVRDAAILIDENIPAKHVLLCIKKTGKQLIKDIRLFDRYAGKQIPQGYVSLAFTIKYQSEKRTLTDEEVNDVHTKICSALKEELKAEIR